MRQFKTVFQFEFMSYLRSKPYLISTGVLVFLALLLAVIPTVLSLFSQDVPKEQHEYTSAPVAIYDSGGTLTQAALDAHLGEGSWVKLDSINPAEIEAAIESEKYSLVLEVDGLSYTVTQPGSQSMLISGSAYNALVKQSWQTAQLEQQGLSESEIENLLTASPVATYVSVGKDTAQSFWLGYLLLVALYIAIILYGNYVMTSVVAEKTSKTVELLIVSVKPVYLIFGKVISAGLAGLAQLCVVIAVSLVSLNLSKDAWATVSPSLSLMLNMSATGIALVYALIFFLLGFFVFAFLYSSFASTVNRSEDVNTIAIYPMLPFIAAFLVAIMGMSNPAAPYITVCSFIPLLSPMVMFMRICMTDVPVLQVLASIMINILTIVGVGIFSAKLYRAGVLMYGTKPSLKNIWHSIRRA